MPPAFLTELPGPIQPDDGEIEVPIQVPGMTVRRRPRRRTANPWDESSGFAFLPGVAVLAAGLAYAAWRFWPKWKGRGTTGPGKTAKSGEAGYASSFKFEGKKRPTTTRQQEPVSAVQAIAMRSLPTPCPHSATDRPKGNAKKNNRVKQSRKDKKHAKEREAKDADNTAAIIAARAKAKGIADAGKTPDTGLVTTMSYERTADAFHHVANWQETGKKTYK